MNIDDCIEVLQGAKSLRTVELRGLGRMVPDNWCPKDPNARFNFVVFEYRLTPDVIYKVELDGVTWYDTKQPKSNGAKSTQGYWVEGEL